jgi:hypothetical protein
VPLSISIALWVSLTMAVLSVTLGAAYCFRNARAAWRDLKQLGSAIDGALAALAEALAAAATRGAELGAGVPRLETALASLRATWRRHQVLRAAWQDVFEAFGDVYPRK